MKQIVLALDLVLDQADLDRLQATSQPYLYRRSSNELYLKHLNHLDYHHPYLALSHGKKHQIINLETGSKQQFFIDNEGLTKPYGVAVGVTENLAMIALGDTEQTKIQVVDVNQPLKVHLNTTYAKDTEQLFPIPRLFSGDPNQAELIYFDGSRLPIDLRSFELGDRKPPSTFESVPKVLSPHLAMLGPFILVKVTPGMSRQQLYSLRKLVEKASESDWIALDTDTVVNTSTVKIADFQEIISQRRQQQQQIQDIIAAIEKQHN